MTIFRTFTDAERAALRLHALDTHQPSALSDAFVLGMRYAVGNQVPQGHKAVPLKKLAKLAGLIDPEPVEVDGKLMVLKNPMAQEVLTRLSAEVRELINYRPPAPGVNPSDDFAQVKAQIMSMPESNLRQFAIAQAIQLGFHEKYGNAMSNANAAFVAEQKAAAGVEGQKR